MSPSTRPGPAPLALARDLPPAPGVTLVEGGADVAVYAGHADGVDEHEVVLHSGVGGDRSEFVGGGDPDPSTLHLLEEVPGPHHAHEHHALDGLDVGAGGDHVHGHGDTGVITVAERL